MIFICVFSLFLLSGFGFSNILVRFLPRSNALMVLSIAPILGAAILIVEGALLATGQVSLSQVRMVGVITIALSIALSSGRLSLFRNIASFLGKISIPQWGGALGLGIVIIVMVLKLEPFQNGLLSFRLGIDLAAYASATSEILGFTPQNNLSIEILRTTHRWGLPSLSAIIYGFIPFSVNIYEVLFAVVMGIYVAGAIAIASIFYLAIPRDHKLGKPEGSLALFTVLALLANSAQANYLNEGFYPQIIGTALLGTALALFMLVRNVSNQGVGCLDEKGGVSKGATVAIMSILFAATTVTYSEGMLLGALFLVGCFILDGIVWSRYRMGCCVLGAAAIVISILLVFPVSKSLGKFTRDNLGNAGNIGYPQPNWMLPSELVGVGTIYADAEKYLDTAVSVRQVRRNKYNVFFGTIFSLFIIYFVIRSAKLFRDLNFAFTGILGVTCFFIVNLWFYFNGAMTPNYAYNKLSSILSVLFVSLSVSGAWWLGQRGLCGYSRLVRQTGLLTLLGGILLTWTLTLNDSREYSAKIDTESVRQLNTQLSDCGCALLPPERGRRGDSMVGKLRYVDRTGDFILSSMLTPPVLDQWNRAAWNFNAGRDSRVYLLVNKDYLGNHGAAFKNLVADSRSYVVIDSGTNVGDLAKKTDVELARWINEDVAGNIIN